MKLSVIKGILCGIIMIGMLGCTAQESENGENGQTLTEEEILNESQEAFDQRMAWWRDATFGMFIHWGPYAVPAGVHNGQKIENCTGEWIMNCAQIPVEEYEQYAKQFNPTEYNAEEWVKIAKDAGMEYIIITSKHHDGFSLWDSEVTEYDAVDFAPIGKDLLAELRQAADKHDIKLGFYYSIMDWHHPNAQAPHYPDYNTDEKSNPNFDKYVENYLKPQVKELVQNYDPAVLWFDGEWIPEWTHEHGVEMYTWLRQMDPDLIINNRVDVGRDGMQGMNEGDQEYVGDFGTPEQEILESTSDFDWEACMTMNDTWGYKSYDNNWKSADSLIYNLTDITAKGGNYLLNVGPTAEGLIPQASIERLHQMGNWLEINGEAIYATERLQHHFRQGENIRYSRKKDEPIYYAFLTEPTAGDVTLQYLKPEQGSQVQLQGYEAPLDWQFSEQDGLVATLPEEAVNNAELGPTLTLKVRGKEIE